MNYQFVYFTYQHPVQWDGKEFKKIDKDVLRITGDSPGLEVPVLEKPEVE